MTLRRPLVSVEVLLSAGVLYLFLTCNGPFWRAALNGLGWDAAGTWVFALSLMGIGGGLYFVFLSPLATRWSARPLLSLLFLVSAAASYYTGRYAVYIDRTMVANVLATHYQEARELITLSMAGHILLFGVLPAALLWWPRLAARPLLRAVGVRLAWTIAAALLAVGSLMLVFADFASLMRNHREVRYLVTPANEVAAGVANAFGRVRRTGRCCRWARTPGFPRLGSSARGRRCSCWWLAKPRVPRTSLSTGMSAPPTPSWPSVT
jgi:lipid A ethanolaminephosphotransferase